MTSIAVRKITSLKCRICGCKLNEDEDDDVAGQLCGSCMGRPEARRLGGSRSLGLTSAGHAPHRDGSSAVDALNTPAPARDFTPAEKALIKRMCKLVAPQQLLDILNERLFSDLGPDAAPYTLAALNAEIGADASLYTAGSGWAGLRKLLLQAQRSGVLAKVDEQLIGLVVGPRGSGKTNTALLAAEQLARQGWVSVLVDPEDEMESLYGEAVADPETLAQRLAQRDQPIVVVRASNATEFIPYGQVILDAADRFRKPLFVVIDEGQVFSATRKRKNDIGEASDIINELVGRGRKRAVNLMITALRYTGTLHRSVFANKNLTLIGTQEDPTVWSALAPQFRASGLDFSDLNTLAPGEFFCISRRGIEKTRVPMADALKKVAAPKAVVAKRTLPTSFSQWARAMRDIPTQRLKALDDPDITCLLGTIAGLSAQQMLQGRDALNDELEVRHAA